MEIPLGLSDKQTGTFLFAVQGVSAVFVGLFLAAYLAGLPTTAVYHSDPTVRFLLTIFGIAVLALILASIVVAALNKHKKRQGIQNIM
jgi:uncharacterized membrane protein YedE/YeeE